MNKIDALKKIIERKKQQSINDFEKEVESLIWSIEKKSQELRELKLELTKLTYEEPRIPDVSDCIED